MKVNRIILSFFCVLFLWAQLGTAIYAEEELSLYATAAVLMDADSGRVLYNKNGDAPMAMASTTKIMTCIIVLENGNLDDMLTVSSYAAGMPKVKLSIRKGEQYQVRDLLYSLMLESHNDAAVALAEYIGKQYLGEELAGKATSEYTVEESKKAVAAFAVLMNAKAKELGCENTYFITPNGLDATETITLTNGEVVQKEHHTTAAELARIMSYCIMDSEKSPEFLEITRKASHSFSANGRSFSCNNHNLFLNMMEGALSGKTGFTNKAGYCYVGSLQRDGRTYVVALLACGWPNNKSYKWSDTKELMQYGVEHYFYKSFLEEGTAFDEKQLKPILIEGGIPPKLGEAAYVDVALAPKRTAEGQKDTLQWKRQNQAFEGLLLKENEEIIVSFHQEERLKAPVERGRVVGNVCYMVNDTIYRMEELVTTEAVEVIDLEWCIGQIWERFCIYL